MTAETTTATMGAADDAKALDGADLATFLTGKLCHDFISPAGAIASGLDLIKDPSAQDMREEAMGLIQASSDKLIALINFARVAYGAATSAERFGAEDLRPLVESVFKGGRAQLDWRPSQREFSKPQARALLNLAQLTGAALPGGGEAVITAHEDAGALILRGEAVGNRARLKPEAETGLKGERLTEGLAGQWIQSYWLWRTVTDHGGALSHSIEDGRVVITARMPSET